MMKVRLPKSPSGGFRTVVPKLVRLSAFLFVVWALGMAVTVRVVNAEVEQMMFGLGAELMKFPGSTDEARELNLNGAQVFMRAEAVEGGMESVLDHYEQLCMQRDAGLGERLRAAIRDPKIRKKLIANAVPPSFADGTIRVQTDRKGIVACLDMGEEPFDAESFAERAKRAIETGNLTDIGHLRYAYAQRIKGAEKTRTQLITMWTETPINVFEMLPLEGKDVAGVDPADIPRPAHTQRILSSWESGKPYGANIYAAQSTPVQLEKFYREELPKNGWRFIETRPGESVDVNGTRVLAVEKGEQIVTLLLDADKKNRGFVTILTSDSL